MCPYIFVHNTLCMGSTIIPIGNFIQQAKTNLKIIGNRETHPLTWLPKLNYIALITLPKTMAQKINCQKHWPKYYMFKYPTTKILFVIKKLGMPRYQIISKNCLIHPQ